MSKVEHGYPLCQKGKQIVKGPTVLGKAHSVDIPLRCPKGSSLVGVSHHHPSGSLHLSEQDKRTAKEKGLSIICVTARNKARCYRFRKGD